MRRHDYKPDHDTSTNILLKLYNGTTMILPKQTTHRDGHTSTTTDFASITPCERCQSWADKHTGVPRGYAGLIHYIKRHDNHWVSAVGACECVYGAWRHQLGKMAWADDEPDAPPGLSNTQWQWLALYRTAGTTLTDAVNAMPDGNIKRELLPQIRQWEAVHARKVRGNSLDSTWSGLPTGPNAMDRVRGDQD